MKKRYLYLLSLAALLIFFDLNNLEKYFKLPDINIISDKKEGIKNKNFNNEIFQTENIEYMNFNRLSYNKINKKYAYYNLKEEKEKKIYNLMEKKVYNISKNKSDTGLYEIEPINIKGDIVDKNIIKKVFKAFQQDNPNIFWLANSVGIVKKENETQIKLKSVICPEKCEKLLNSLKIKINEILKNMPKEASEYERELYLHDLIIKMCKYARKTEGEIDWRKFTIIGAILDGEAVCEGFSKAMQILLNEVGVECRVVTGKIGEESHMWNLVKIGGNWYHLDVTWDEPSEIGRYNYFNLTDNEIKFDHKIDEDIIKVKSLSKNDKYNFKLPKCITKTENYFYKNALMLDLFNKETDNYMIKNIKKVVSRGIKYIYILINEKMDFDDAINQLFKTEPYKFFYYLSEVEKDINFKNKVDKRRIYFLPNKAIGAVSIEINYV